MLSARSDAVEYAHKQLGISEELDAASMRAEAYLNLARTHERLGGLEKYVARIQTSETHIFSNDLCGVAQCQPIRYAI